MVVVVVVMMMMMTMMMMTTMTTTMTMMIIIINCIKRVCVVPSAPHGDSSHSYGTVSTYLNDEKIAEGKRYG